MMGQWEYQIFSKGAKDAGDQIWISRYLLERVAEKYGMMYIQKRVDFGGQDLGLVFLGGKYRV